LAKKLNQFYIYKLSVSTVIENNFNINSSFSDAKKHGWIVSLGDNQILKFIRDIKHINFNSQIDRLKELYKLRDDLKNKVKSQENSREISKYQNEINDILYIPDVVTVYSNRKKKDYKKVCKNKFIINNITYSRLCAGAGQIRRNTVLFVNDNIKEELEKRMMCGLTKKRIGKINLAKFSAYYSLYGSSTNIITTPRVCVIKDYEYIFKNQKVDWIYEKDNGERDIEERVIDIPTNIWDGSGLVSVEMAEQWNKDLNIDDYKPSAYIVRSAWIKGLCVVFDWKRYAREIAHKEYITDVWGKTRHINDIDVILTTSQFKMWKKYDNWEEYLKYHELYKHVWGCSRVNKKEDKYFTQLNYQYLQSTSYTPENIKKLADFSINWIKNVLTGDKIYILLYLLGCHEYDSKIEEVEKDTDLDIVKAIMYNDEILKDQYVKNRIYKSIEKKVKELKIGKLLVEGSYEFAIVDPYGFCEYVFGEIPVGLLKENQLWNKRWVDKGSKEVSLMRSPLVSPNENQVLQVYSDEKCDNWFQTIQSGVILNIWDTTLMRASDGDTDGDLLLSTDNIYHVNSVDRTLNPITYEKSTVKEQTLSNGNLVKMDTKGFNTKIGFITNLATSFLCLREIYKKDSKEYKEFTRRINLLRFHQGSAIDAGKGNIYIAPPKEWSKRVKINYETDNEEVKQKKYFQNKLAGNKKSYFMCYIYPALMKKYKQHKESSNRISRGIFGLKLDELLNKKDKNDIQKKFVRNYYNYLPVLTNKSIMNELCRYVEKADFDMKYLKTQEEFDYSILMNDMYKVNPNSQMYQLILSILKKYHKIYELNTHERKNIQEDYDFYSDLQTEEFEESYDDELKLLFQEIEGELYSVCSNKHELSNYIVYIMYNHFKNKSKAIMWNIVGEEIIDVIKQRAITVVYPVESKKDEEGSCEYLGKYYKLKEVALTDNI
jgi:hypothetical protein